MSYQNDIEAYCLATTYNLMPPVILNKAYKKEPYSGKYEPDANEYGETRTMLLAQCRGGANCLVKYNPNELPLE